jgi:CRP-like cAMP-binding protein
MFRGWRPKAHKPFARRQPAENTVSQPIVTAPVRGNRVLNALSGAQMEALRPLLEPVELVKDQVLIHQDEPASHVWFPDRGVISILSLAEDGASIEVAIIGRDGMTGGPIVLGGETTIFTALVQVPGEGKRIEASSFRRFLREHPDAERVFLRSVLGTMTMMGQNAACSQMHGVDARCARWLLLTHDDVDNDAFLLTQEYLAMMLGVTRPSVSAAASALQQAGLIRYSRGLITVVDRAGLERAACSCYGLIRRELDRLLGS